MELLSEQLDEFWNWIGLSPKEYADLENKKGINEFHYPNFTELQESAYEQVLLSNEDAVDDILSALAIDNESENVLDYIIENASNEFVELIVQEGLYHIQREARWQIAELIYRRRPNNSLSALITLSSDKDSYVRKRAKNTIMLFDQ